MPFEPGPGAAIAASAADRRRATAHRRRDVGKSGRAVPRKILAGGAAAGSIAARGSEATAMAMAATTATGVTAAANGTAHRRRDVGRYCDYIGIADATAASSASVLSYAS